MCHSNLEEPVNIYIAQNSKRNVSHCDLVILLFQQNYYYSLLKSLYHNSWIFAKYIV